MTIDSILTEWCYRLPKGYPETVQDFEVLRDIITEMTDIDLSEAERIVRNAMGITEASEDEDPKIETNSNQTEFLNATDFENYILEHYSVPGQTIGGLQVLYEQLRGDVEVMKLIQSKTPEVSIRPGPFRIQGKFDRLYDAIETNIKIKNGHASELWFSIVFKGIVKGAVKNIPSMGIENDLKSDVITRDGTRFSLKAYNDITFDFGMLPKNAIMYLRSFISLAELITGKKLETSSLGINDINKNILETLNQEQIQEEIKELLKLDSPFSVIKNLQSEIQKILYNMNIESPDYLESVTKRFCVTIDNFIEKHVSENIDYWALIIIPNKTLNLIPSNTIVRSLQHTEENGHYYLSTNISNFHQNHLNIKTSQLGVSAAQYKD
jgi:hypothetical protein